MKIRFVNVGRFQRSWDWTPKRELTHRGMTQQVKEHGSILSNELDFLYNEETNEGVISAGLRTVGTFSIENEAA